jgi:hypothetical protein
MIEPRNIPYVNNLIPGLLDALPEPLYVWPSVSGIMARVYANRAEFDRFGGAFVSISVDGPGIWNVCTYVEHADYLSLPIIDRNRTRFAVDAETAIALAIEWASTPAGVTP